MTRLSMRCGQIIGVLVVLITVVNGQTSEDTTLTNEPSTSTNYSPSGPYTVSTSSTIIVNGQTSEDTTLTNEPSTSTNYSPSGRSTDSQNTVSTSSTITEYTTTDDSVTNTYTSDSTTISPNDNNAYSSTTSNYTTMYTNTATNTTEYTTTPSNYTTMYTNATTNATEYTTTPSNYTTMYTNTTINATEYTTTPSNYTTMYTNNTTNATEYTTTPSNYTTMYANATTNATEYTTTPSNYTTMYTNTTNTTTTAPSNVTSESTTTSVNGSAQTSTQTTTTNTTDGARQSNTTTAPTSSALASEELFDYGYENGDYGFSGDDSLAYVRVPRGFPTDKDKEYYLYISTNGYITFGRYYNSHISKTFPFSTYYYNSKIVAPFWADATTYYYRYYYYYYYYSYYYYYYYLYSSRVYYQVFVNGKTRYSEDASHIFDRVNKLISEKKNTKPFKARWILKVTWYQVMPFSRTEDNTYQCILATDYLRSFTIFLYGEDQMNWPDDSYSITPSIGFQMSTSMYYNTRFSKTLRAMRIDQEKGNTGKKGLFVFRLDSNKVVPPSIQCLTWYEEQTIDDYRQMQELDSLLSDCPCTIWQAFRDPRFRYAWWESDYYLGNYCFYVRLSPFRRKGSRGCCYKRVYTNSRSRWGWWWRRVTYTLNTDPQTGGGLVAYNPVSFRQYPFHSAADKVPHLNCCILSGLCSLYRQYRWLSTCSRYVPVRRARFWGDPHITTLDDQAFTFNGFGEYILLDQKDKNSGDAQMMIQGRTERVLNDMGERTDATIFTAFAARDFETNATMQVELNKNKTGLNVFCNQVDYTVRFQNLSSQFEILDDNLGCNRPENSTLSVTFLSGVSMNVSVGIELLEISVSFPGELASNSSTGGLLGVFNGNSSDDFTLPNGTVIPINSTEKDIFHQFGQKWMVTESNSVFTYRSGDGPSNHSYPDFTPKFLSDYPSARVEEARGVCGSDNKECIFDYLSTNRTDVAVSSNATAASVGEENAIANNAIPTVMVQSTIEAVVGEAVNVQVTATDADGESVAIYLVNNITGFNNITQTDNVAIFTWVPDSLDPVTISLYGTDASGSDSPVNTTRVLLCNGCSGNGQCDFNSTDETLDASSNNNTLFSLVECNCDVGWSGIDCGTDLDGCADNPCPEGSDCTDFTPEQQAAENGTAYNCSSCPTGTEEIAGKCSDIDECNGTAVCDQLCFNTDGSFICTCNSGYTLQDNTVCMDNDECSLGTHNCSHLCTNMDGGYNCSCREGFLSQDGGFTCEQDPNNDVCSQSSLTCDHGCTAVNGHPTCFCRNGYQLETDGSCTDMDECLGEPCDHLCTNTDGGFRCSCRTGYQLNTDQLNCDECDQFHWGPNCGNDCDCNENALECHNIRGCVCKPGYTGDDCDDDIDECITTQCAFRRTCENNPGGYECVCNSGFQEDGNGNCVDIDECSDDSLHTCIYKCENVIGSHLCKCSDGYTGNGNNCTDIDECNDGIPRCEQKCVNSEGSYNCDCYRGYQLNDDRETCTDVDGLCGTNSVCNQICSVNETLDVICLCNPGYKLRNDTFCEDINECDMSVCADTCINTDGAYRCECTIPGYQLDNDGKTCIVCNEYHWGVNCASECNCGVGGDCDKATGCKCKSGWRGTTCSEDILECSDPQLCPESNTLCVELLGSYRCDCANGYELNNGQCQDSDECQSYANDCSQECINTIGSYECRCYPGYRDTQNNGRSCTDIDECTEGHRCEALCQNTPGGYSCQCHPGFVLNNDTFTCQSTSTQSRCGSNQLTCDYACVNDTHCVCSNGFQLQQDGTTCKAQRYQVQAKVSLNFGYSTYRSDPKQIAYNFQEALRQLYLNIPNFSTVIIVNIFPGSVILDHYVVFTSLVSLSQTQSVATSLLTAYNSGSLTVAGAPILFTAVPSLTTTSSGEFLVTVTLSCNAEPCELSEHCCVEEGTLKCRSIGDACRLPAEEETAAPETNSQDNRLALGLGIGLPLGVIAIIAAVVARKKCAPKRQGRHELMKTPEGSRILVGSRRSSRVSPALDF